MLAKHFPDEPLGAVALNGPAEFSGRGNPQPRTRAVLGQQEHRHQSAMSARSTIVNFLELVTPPEATICAKAAVHWTAGRQDGHRARSCQREDTLRRFRPLARRRLRTRRPFLLLMRTRKPCVRRRRRLFG